MTFSKAHPKEGFAVLGRAPDVPPDHAGAPGSSQELPGTDDKILVAPEKGSRSWPEGDASDRGKTSRIRNAQVPKGTVADLWSHHTLAQTKRVRGLGQRTSTK